jgi:hypothetical protein
LLWISALLVRGSRLAVQDLRPGLCENPIQLELRTSPEKAILELCST